MLFVSAVLCVTAMFSVPARAQGPATTPLQVCAQTPIRNEFGDVLPGHFHSAPGERALVQVLWANEGILPPNPDGTPAAQNAILPSGQTGIGARVSPSLTEPGIFSIGFADPRPISGKLFVRVFNKPTLEESLFYGDSQVMDVTSDSRIVLIAEITATDKIIDYYRDTDGDGLPDWWEHLNFGGNPTGASAGLDDDGDGMTTEQEFRAGTDPQDDSSYLAISAIWPVSDENIMIRWQSVAGLTYEIQYTTNDLSLNPDFETIPDHVTATGGVTEAEIPGGFEGDLRHYRLRVVE